MRDQLLERLQGNFGSLAGNAVASHVVGRCFATGGADWQECIAGELAAHEAALSATTHGAQLLRTFAVHEYRKNKDQWRQRVHRKETAVKEFAELFKTAPAAAAAAAAAAAQEDGEEEAEEAEEEEEEEEQQQQQQPVSKKRKADSADGNKKKQKNKGSVDDVMASLLPPEDVTMKKTKKDKKQGKKSGKNY